MDNEYPEMIRGICSQRVILLKSEYFGGGKVGVTLQRKIRLT